MLETNLNKQTNKQILLLANFTVYNYRLVIQFEACFKIRLLKNSMAVPPQESKLFSGHKNIIKYYILINQILVLGPLKSLNQWNGEISKYKQSSTTIEELFSTIYIKKLYDEIIIKMN